MLYLKTSVKNGVISLCPLNPDEMYYKCEVWGIFMALIIYRTFRLMRMNHSTLGSR